MKEIDRVGERERGRGREGENCRKQVGATTTKATVEIKQSIKLNLTYTANNNDIICRLNFVH